MDQRSLGRRPPFAAALAAPMSRAWRFRALRRLKAMPKAVRMGIGVMLVVGGVLGFLPVLGFWMIPLGVIVLALDIAWVRRSWRAVNDQQKTGVRARAVRKKRGETSRSPKPRA